MSSCTTSDLDLISQFIQAEGLVSRTGENNTLSDLLELIAPSLEHCKDVSAEAETLWVASGHYGHRPSFAFGLFAVIAFSIATVLHLGATWVDFRRYKRWFSIVFFPGGFLQIFGWVERMLAHSDVRQESYFMASLASLTIAPVFFSAAIYAFMGYLIAAKDSSVLPRRFGAKKLSWTFITIDFITLVIQAVGGGLASSDDPDESRTGADIMLAGIILQLLTMIALSFLFIWYLWKVRVWQRLRFSNIFANTAEARYNQLVIGMAWSIFFVIFRGVFRTAELEQGFRGNIAETQAFLWVFDALPMLLVMLIFIAVHPYRTLPGISFTSEPDSGSDTLMQERKSPLATPPQSSTTHLQQV